MLVLGVIALIAAACGSATPTSVATEIEDGVLGFVSGIDSDNLQTNEVTRLIGGRTYQSTETQIPFRFTLPDNGQTWQGVQEDEWSLTAIVTLPGGNDEEVPGLILAVAEEGATPETVAEAIEDSTPEAQWQQSNGLFEGRDALIVEGTTERDAVVEQRGSDVQDLLRISTGERSDFPVLLRGARSYRSHIFEEQGRVIIVTVDAMMGFEARATAELASALDTLEIRGAA